MRLLQGTWPKWCACGNPYSPSQWQTLTLVGYQADEVETLELRDCTCGSTLAVAVAEISNPLVVSQVHQSLRPHLPGPHRR